MKKLLIVFLMVFMFIPSIYAETEYKVMNFDEVLTEEGIEHDFSNYTESDDKITIYFFRGKGCKFCRAFLSYLNDIVPEYGKYFNVVAYDVWNDRNSDKLYKKITSKKHASNGNIIKYAYFLIYLGRLEECKKELDRVDYDSLTEDILKIIAEHEKEKKKGKIKSFNNINDLNRALEN